MLPNSNKQVLKLKFLKQHGMSNEEYIGEFEQILMSCDAPEMEEQTIARFLGGMKIADLVELQPYWSVEDICKLATKVGKQLKGDQEIFN